ncbi:MlrC C-terminal domain-containing protein [Bradyrhizobium sp. RT9a]|uniref:MlrC C-terminal domain-containing protein n=1 Tax=Bradyrhizobium sp. RT9a TaxID=3156384 RepID=UPI0033908A98
MPTGLDPYKAGVFLVRTSTARLELFRNVGIDPLTERIVVVKMARPLMGSDGSIAKKLIHIDNGGLLTVDFCRIPYRCVNRPIWPLDEKSSPSLIY